MSKKTIIVLLVALAIGSIRLAEAQQPKKVPRIAYLSASSASSQAPRLDAFRQGLRELGYVEGKNIVIEYRSAEGKLDRLPDLAAELVRINVDLIVTASEPAVSAAKKASSTIPIVFAVANDPVGSGLVSSLARPGGNATGLVNLTPELDGKRLELLKESFTKAARVAVFWESGRPRGNLPFTQLEALGKVLGLKLQSLAVRGLDDFDSAFESAKRGGTQALLTIPSPVINTAREAIVGFATKNRLPGMYAAPEFVEGGGLMSYGPDLIDQYRRAATYADKILKGAKPADLPVEQPTKFEFVINLKAAKQIGLTIPPNVLARADKVIK
jgi:putative tryptophan/tyrosine transport system substrate-binding protein